jgi:glycosyltransferase involved in cell wall biosynthesis
VATKEGRFGVRDPLVSVIVAVKDGERFLAAAIQSILEQNYRSFEIIVVDGHSVDHTAEIAQSFSVVRYVRQVNRGVGDGYNVGLAAARGELIAFLSHDDLWTPDKLQIQVERLLLDPTLQYVVARVRFLLEAGFAVPPRFRRELLEGDHVAYIMETLLARRSLFDTIGKFNPQLTSAEDVDWYARAKDKNIPCTVISKVLVFKRVHDANTSLQFDNHNLLATLRRSIIRKRFQSPNAVDIQLEDNAS